MSADTSERYFGLGSFGTGRAIFRRGYDIGRKDAVKWHYFEDNDFPPNEGEEYLICYKRPVCEIGWEDWVCDKLECEIFDENCKYYYFTYDVDMGGEQSYSDGYAIAWCELPRVAEELKEKYK